MKITNVKEKSGSRTTDYFLLVEDENGWKPNSNVDFIQVGLDPYKRYWWQLGKTDKTPAVLDVTIEQAKGLLDKGYSFEVMEDTLVKITNIKYGNITFIEYSDGWRPDTTNTRYTRSWEVEKYLDPAKKYWSVSVSDKSKSAVAELKFEDAIALKFEGYTFDIVEGDEEMNETEGPKFYALQDKYGLVFKLPENFQDGFRAGKVVTKPITSGYGYLIFTNFEQAQKIADYSYPAGGLDKLKVVEVDPIAKKVIKVVEEPKQTKWRIAWSGGESTPKWFRGNEFGAWSLVTSKSEAREFDTLKDAERIVKILGLNGLYITEGK